VKISQLEGSARPQPACAAKTQNVAHATDKTKKEGDGAAGILLLVVLYLASKLFFSVDDESGRTSLTNA
jgi:uncharacterized protein HemX